jgi:8-oxo-dGTP diphosphatase
MLVLVEAGVGFDPSSLPTKRVASGALIRDAAGSVLLVKPTYKDGWEIPGGLVEPGESPKEAARRECLEELGQPIEIGGLLCVHYADGVRLAGDGVVFVFDGGRSSAGAGDFVLPADELSAAAFVPPAELGAHLPVVMVRRLHAAITASGTATIAYLER